MKKTVRIVSVVLCIIMLFTVPAHADYKALEESDEFTFLNRILSEIHEVYWYDIEDEDLFRRTFQTMLKENPELLEPILRAAINSLDDYSKYFTAEEWEEYMKGMEREFGGIGVTMSVEGKYVAVFSIIKDMPAEKAGLQIGDKIVTVNGEDMTGLDTDKVRSKVIGEVGTSVKLGILRSEQMLEFDIVRGVIKEDSVYYDKMDDIAYIYITNFNLTTSEELKKVLKQVDEEGLTKIVLDLRYNPGGYVDAAVKVARNFVPKGLIGTAKYKYANTVEEMTSDLEKTKYELAVLINQNSASAAELVASAIQESGAGVLVGECSYGKAVIQGEYPILKDSHIKLTIGAYFTRNGNQINKIGIEPNYKVYNKEVDFEFSGAKPLNFMKKYTIGDQHEGVLAAKQRLVALEYRVGAINEKFDGTMAEAVAKFQEDAGLFPYGVLDINTQIMLDNKALETSVNLDMQLSKAIELLGGKPLYPTVK